MMFNVSAILESFMLLKYRNLCIVCKRKRNNVLIRFLSKLYKMKNFMLLKLNRIERLIIM